MNWQDWIGRAAVAEDVLTGGLLARYRATFDSDGNQVPQGIHWCLCLPDAPTAALGGDGHPAHGGFLPPIDLPRRMWAASDVTFLRPLAIGDRIHRTSTIQAIDEKNGRSGRLLFVTVAHETVANGDIAIRETQSLVFREPAPPGAASVTAAAPGDGAPAWDWQRALVPGAPLLFRYSALSFNSHRIHYDLPYATAGEGYAGLVVHGPLMASLLLDLVARNAGPNRLAQFAFRAVAPAFADAPLSLLGRADGKSLALEVQGADGRTHVTASGALA